MLMTGYASFQELYTGNPPRRPGNTSPDTSPSGAFYATDRSFLINCGNTQIFQRLMTQVLEMPELAQDPKYANNKDRIERREELSALLQEAFSKQPWSYWFPRMRAAGVPCGELRSVGDAIHSPEAIERGIVTRVAHPELGWVPNMTLPIRYSATPLADPVAAPRVGQHTEQVLADWLGCAPARISELAQAGAFGATKENKT